MELQYMFHMTNLSLMLWLFEEPVTVVRVQTGTNSLGCVSSALVKERKLTALSKNGAKIEVGVFKIGSGDPQRTKGSLEKFRDKQCKFF